MGVRELKHAALLREWSGRIAECRSSGKSVKEWCASQGIVTKTYYYWEKRFVAEASRRLVLPVDQPRSLVQVNPDILDSGGTEAMDTGVTIRHGQSIIGLPAGSSAEAVAKLVKALNGYA